jgi:hypothetical protein
MIDYQTKKGRLQKQYPNKLINKNTGESFECFCDSCTNKKTKMQQAGIIIENILLAITALFIVFYVISALIYIWQ